MPWFFDATPVDHVALERLRRAALAAAAALDNARAQRLHATTRHLARCAGPFADELVERSLRAAAEDERLATACRRLASLAIDAAADAARDTARRELLRDTFTAELRRDAQRAAEGEPSPSGTSASDTSPSRVAVGS